MARRAREDVHPSGRRCLARRFRPSNIIIGGGGGYSLLPRLLPGYYPGYPLRRPASASAATTVG